MKRYTSQTPAPLTFLLGCERSGSTWLANILDAHEDIELLMEPFAPYARLFPGFPGRNIHVRESHPELAGLVQRGLGNLAGKKYSLLYRPGRPLRLKSIDVGMTRMLRRVCQRLRVPPPLTALQWGLLNLNTSELPVSIQTSKRWPPRHFVVKELRLNLKVKLLLEAVPDARFLVIVRDPAAQVTSIRRLMERGRLQELASALKTLPADMARDAWMERYRRWIQEGDDAHTLAVWWFLNYETLLADLAASGAPTLFVRHEDLSAQPHAWTGKVLAFLGLEMNPHVERFLHASSGGPPRSDSPLDTFRDSARHSQETIRDADRTLAEHLRRVAEGLPCAPALRDYFTHPRF